MKYKYSFLLLLVFLITGCVQSENCNDEINKLPAFGNVKKCKEQIAADKDFLTSCDNTFKSRKDAAAHMVMRGWQYFYNKKYDTAMMRFNQAWLLDSLNSEIYWGFGNLLGSQHKFRESIPFFEKSLKLNPNNAKTWDDLSTSYGNSFFETKDVKYLNSAIYALEKAISINPNDAHSYSQLTSAFSYFTQKDSAKKYLKITERLDPKAVNPEVKKMLSE